MVRGYILTAAQSTYYKKFDKNTGEEVLLKWGGKGNSAVLNENLYKGLRTFAKERDAELRILPIQGKMIRENQLHESLRDLPELYDWSKHEKLNRNISQSNIRVPPQNVDPATSRQHLPAKYRSTLVYPHSKQRLLTVASFNSQLPRLLATTGCLTTPNYNRKNDKGDQAVRDHVMGALYVEIINETHYNLRFLTSTKNGKFVDMGKTYDGTRRTTKAGIEALVLGDIHWGEHEQKTIEANYEMIDFFKPKRLILHDFFNGGSISHHEANKPLYRAKKYNSGGLILEQELKSLFTEMIHLSKMMGKRKIEIVHSNHDDFLPKYLEAGEWRNHDLWNAELCHTLGGRIISNNVAEDMYLKEALSMFGKIPSNVHFLGLRSDLKPQGFQLASHGHKGINGARGGKANSREKSLGKSISGHTHAPEQFRDAYIVGTSSRTDLEYMAGSSSSAMAANAVLYNNGKVQILPVIKGKWGKD